MTVRAGEEAARLSRRELFQLGLGAATLAACSSRPAREILPYAAQPPELTPGVARHYATALVEDGFATGVVVASHEGRPTKLEGNPAHPASLGGTRAIEQAAILSLFDPARLRAPTARGAPVAWPAIDAALAEPRGLAIVMEPTTSPQVIELIRRVRERGARVAFWSAFSPRAQLAGHRLAFGRPVQRQLRLDRADVIVALDADLVADHPMASAYARQLSDRRRVVDARSAMSRIYAIEASYTALGVIADHRFAVRPSQLAAIAAQLCGAVARRRPGAMPAAAAERWLEVIADDLVRARGVVVCGERQPAAVHALVAAINAMLASEVVAYSEPVAFEAGTASHELAPVVEAIDRGEVATLAVLGGDPAYASPADLALGEAIARVERSVYVGLHANETARRCRHVAPGLHDLEQWGAARAYDGTLTPQQPLIEPLFGGRSIADVLHHVVGDPPRPAHERMRAAWPSSDLDDALVRGVSGEPAAAVAVTPDWAAIARLRPAATSGLELELRPHPFVHDGRHATNPWLLELPEPTTKLTYGNAAQLSPATAAQLGVATGDEVLLAVDGRSLAAPVVVVPGHADGALALQCGVGANAFALWTTAAGLQPAVVVTPLGRRRALAITQDEMDPHGRPLALAATLGELADPGERFAAHRGPQPSLYAARVSGGPQWAMTIDLTTCTGCTACVMACAAENNTPAVGPERIREHREMHWLRIDRYVDDGGARVQPMTCQHCEHAPCEYVCPTAATSHSPDGLNEMTYNRCIGTRFCANNCPYKVRRFNWFDLRDRKSLRVLGKNPDVTVRDRGVMEKCTYCVQRLRRAEIDARIAGAPIAGVQTACQQACPTQAIAFGSLTDAASPVVEQRARPHAYAVLHDQGTRPRTQYLARIRNPNEALR
jgi:molybdopterin-containing oxidoreductase family iron-sulfur binding subunit